MSMLYIALPVFLNQVPVVLLDTSVSNSKQLILNTISFNLLNKFESISLPMNQNIICQLQIFYSRFCEDIVSMQIKKLFPETKTTLFAGKGRFTKNLTDASPRIKITASANHIRDQTIT